MIELVRKVDAAIVVTRSTHIRTNRTKDILYIIHNTRATQHFPRYKFYLRRSSRLLQYVHRKTNFVPIENRVLYHVHGMAQLDESALDTRQGISFLLIHVRTVRTM